MEVEVEPEGAEEEEEGDGVRGRSTPRRRRRSSMHAASLRLARHTARDSATPQPTTPRKRSLRR